MRALGEQMGDKVVWWQAAEIRAASQRGFLTVEALLFGR